MIFRALLAYIYIPVVQRELDEFREIVWNHNRGRKQGSKVLPTGVPSHIYHNPEYYGGKECGKAISKEMLDNVSAQTKILEDDHDFFNPELRGICETVIPEPEMIKAVDAPNMFLQLKNAVYDQLARDT